MKRVNFFISFNGLVIVFFLVIIWMFTPNLTYFTLVSYLTYVRCLNVALLEIPHARLVDFSPYGRRPLVRSAHRKCLLIFSLMYGRDDMLGSIAIFFFLFYSVAVFLTCLSRGQPVYLFVWHFVRDIRRISGLFVLEMVLCNNIFPQTAQR